ncbi:MAG: 3-keto-5-aminohexanoate cleavage protein, partial [Rhodospirillales bacterium]|nr:3-keto-5-aminohexanoate cleavage protein [Rhodospirillales bacterium]
SETVDVAKACFDAGADGIHAHVRDEEQNHTLDAGLYRELQDEMALQVPQMVVQITTEAVGRYSATEQRQLVYDLTPRAASVSLKEMMSDDDKVEAGRFYNWAFEFEIAVQHILYSVEEVTRLFDLVREGVIPDGPLQVLFVLGRHTKDQQSDPASLNLFLDALPQDKARPEWAICAFGKNEILCLVEAAKQGGKARIGFENSIWNDDGSVAKDNAERVKALVERIQAK